MYVDLFTTNRQNHIGCTQQIKVHYTQFQSNSKLFLTHLSSNNIFTTINEAAFLYLYHLKCDLCKINVPACNYEI